MNDPSADDARIADLTQGSLLFLRIWVAIFLAASATFFLLMTLSAKVFASTGSAFAANTVVLTQWLPAVLALPLIKAAVARHSARALLVFCEVGGTLLLPLVSVWLEQVGWLIGLLLVKGAFDALSKVSRTVALKGYFQGRALDRAASYYNTAALAGGGMGALCGALLLERLSLPGVLLMCGLMQLAAAGVYLSLPAGAKPAATQGSKGRAFPLDPGLRAAIVYFVAAVCLYQGFHNIARSAFPVSQLGMRESGIALVQMLTNLAYIAGAFVAARIVISGGRYAAAGPFLHLLVLVSLIPLPFMSAQVPGLALYALFACLFEIAFCVHLRHIITAAPSERMARIVADANAWAVGSMVVFSLLGSWLVDRTGLGTVVAIAIVAALAVPGWVHLMNLRLHTPRASERPQEG
ncbi:MFS transporter [Paracidovorax anthurii]|uniref:MFS transporter n=1 Tax=Paracidovorax anthurii TaxID=78229 RepID=A0A328Z6I7_9BURK|nr:MFS transporter [Paracidovorax anthurii]RAR81354.1 MFS transporter [Paracidovorax anthurii]